MTLTNLMSDKWGLDLRVLNLGGISWRTRLFLHFYINPAFILNVWRMALCLFQLPGRKPR